LDTNPIATRKPLYLTFALMLCCFGSISCARVAFSLYALQLGASASVVGIVVATLYIFPLLISWPVGRYSDRVGSRWLLLFGTVCGSCAMMIPYFVREISALYVAGTLLGAAFALYNVLLQNLVGLLSKPHERARNFSNSSLIGASTNFAGPLLAGIAIDHSGPANACLYLVSLLVIWGDRLPGGTRHSGPGRSIKETLAHGGMVRILMTSSLVQVGQDLYQFYIPVYGYGIGLSASAIGGVLATFAAASFFVRFLMPYLIARRGEETVLRYSFGLAMIGFVLVPFFHNAVALALISFTFGLGMGCGQPITTMMIFSRSVEGRSGEILGLRQTVNNLMRVSCPPVFGLIASAFGLSPVFWLSALIMGGGSVLTRSPRDESEAR
jgi:MFS family permease